MHAEPFRMDRESPYSPTYGRGRAGAVRRTWAWPFPQPDPGIAPELRRAALNVLCTTARDWGLTAAR